MEKKLYDLATIIVLAGIASIAAVGFISHKYFGHDNHLEENAEEVLKAKLGLDIDFTPASEEEGKQKIEVLKF